MPQHSTKLPQLMYSVTELKKEPGTEYTPLSPVGPYKNVRDTTDKVLLVSSAGKVNVNT